MHLGNFIRGILATIYVQLADGVTAEQVDAAYASAYDGKPIVRLSAQWPSIAGVAGTPFCDLHWQVEGDQLIVASAIDKLRGLGLDAESVCGNAFASRVAREVTTYSQMAKALDLKAD